MCLSIVFDSGHGAWGSECSRDTLRAARVPFKKARARQADVSTVRKLTSKLSKCARLRAGRFGVEVNLEKGREAASGLETYRENNDDKVQDEVAYTLDRRIMSMKFRERAA